MIDVVRGWLAFRRLRRRIRETPRYHLADLPENTLARLDGIVRPLGKLALEAPLTRRLCVYYGVRVRAQMASGWFADLADERKGIPFLLEDGGHHAVIDVTDAKIVAVADHRTTSKAMFDASPAQRELLARLDLREQDWWNTVELVYTESVLELDERITVLGGGTREPDPDATPAGGYRDGAPMRYRLAGTARAPLVITDEPDAIAGLVHASLGWR